MSTGIGDTDYARLKRRLMDIINSIRRIGGQLEVDLPRIAVIGNQSAGKSSLVEAISEITVPRGEQTCTRCPTEVRIKQSDEPWTCQVFVRFEFDVNGLPCEGVKELEFGPRIVDGNRDQIEKLLRKAQLAILNPSRALTNLQQFIDMPLSDGDATVTPLPELQFSRNVVVIEIAGPQCTDLTFVDLPGIIADDEDEPGSIDLIKDLVGRHIHGDNCLILVTITMRDDKKNQHAIKMAREADPERKRTIPVLTKPDTLEAGQDRYWLKLVRNDENPMPHGYFVTRQPNLKEREDRITREGARENERLFFSNDPWSTLPHEIQDRLGTSNLTSALSTLLSNHIQAKLPGIIEKLDQDYRHVLDELRALPESLSEDPVRYTAKLCENLRDSISACTLGAPGHEMLMQEVNAVSKRFKAQIWSTKLHFPISTRSDADLKRTEPRVTLSELRSRKELSLSDMRDFIELSRTRELPFDIPPAAKKGLIEMSTGRWRAIAIKAFSEVKPILSNHVINLVDVHFGRFEQGSLKNMVLASVENEIDNLADKTLSEVNALLDLEFVPYTQNEHYLSRSQDKCLSELRSKRIAAPPGSVHGEEETPMSRPETPMSMEEGTEMPRFELNEPTYPVEFVERNYYIGSTWVSKASLTQDILSKLATLGYTGLRSDAFAKLVSDDPYERELNLMAEVTAYFLVAYKRIIDDAPRVIDRNLVLPAGQCIHDALVRSLGIYGTDGPQRCREYLAESPRIVSRRKELTQRKKRLDQIKMALRSFGSNSNLMLDDDLQQGDSDD